MPAPVWTSFASAPPLDALPEVCLRISHALDQRTRTMAVELDVMNCDGSLAPGMYPTVKWPVRRVRVTTTERTFVIRDQGGQADWVNVRKGVADGDLVEVIGNLKPGDMVVRRATDEIQDGTALQLSAQKTP